MGIYDREYYREEETGFFGERSMVTNLVLANVAAYIANFVLQDHVFGSALFKWMTLTPDVITHPWNCYQLLTYGFAHDPNDLRHLVFNMLFLWFAGRDVETIYGRREFLLFYLTAVVVSGFVFAVVGFFAHSDVPVMGASGGVMAVLALYVLHYPRRTILVMFVLPLPAWVVGLLYFISEVSGALHPSDDNTAHVAHVAGAVFAFIYFRNRWNLSHLLPGDWRLSRMLRSRPKLRVHEPDDDDQELRRRVDEILEKISRSGEASLTRQERRTLEEASRRYQRRQSG